MHLMRMEAGQASLEFTPEEKHAVFAALQRLGPATIKNRVTYQLVTLGSVELLHTDEWDDPCLIAGTPAGIALLEQIQALSSFPQELRRAS